jgi:hypothetical protein
MSKSEVKPKIVIIPRVVWITITSIICVGAFVSGLLLGLYLESANTDAQPKVPLPDIVFPEPIITPLYPDAGFRTEPFGKLDNSYYLQVKLMKTVPDFRAINDAYEISIGRGNYTAITFYGIVPDKVLLTFFNGTHIATTTYYSQLSYWTEPAIEKGEL